MQNWGGDKSPDTTTTTVVVVNTTTMAGNYVLSNSVS